MIDIKEYKKASKDYKKNWALLNDTLYTLCEDNPGHSSLSAINAKFYIIGRTYASGIERIRRNPDGEAADLADLAEYIHKNRREVAQIFKRLSKIREPLTLNNLEIMIDEHGRLLNILKKGLRGRAPRSFASKYLHFHCPVVPIFDSIALSELSEGRRWSRKYELFAMPLGADKHYYRFAMRFWRYYEEAREKNLKPTTRFIDNYLHWMVEE